jgi:hypothetical protein
VPEREGAGKSTKPIYNVKTKPIKAIKGYGIVGTWIDPRQLGGSLPPWISDSEIDARRSAAHNKRLYEFRHETEQWLCEIDIRPIARVRKLPPQQSS